MGIVAADIAYKGLATSATRERVAVVDVVEAKDRGVGIWAK
jgi:hypothetical protein